MEKKIYNLLGLAQRAGKIVSGEGKVDEYIKKKKVYLVIIAHDAGENTKDVFSKLLKKVNIQSVLFGSKVNLGLSIGKSPRAVIGILDQDFSEVFLKEINTDWGR